MCPTPPLCSNTITLCDECVHDRWIGNFMFAYIAKLFDISDWTANKGADVKQKGGSDPPWDTADPMAQSTVRSRRDAPPAQP